MATLKDLIVQGASRFVGDVTGIKFAVAGGTSSQFLKADGSLDSSTYSSKVYAYSAVTSNINSFVSPIAGTAANNNKEALVIINNTGSTDITLTIPTAYKTVNGMEIVVTIPSGGFAKVECVVLNATVFVTVTSNSGETIDYTTEKELAIVTALNDLEARVG